MLNQYYISKVSATGEDRDTSTVDLNPGLNIVYGPSNTGKSYIFSCIKYVLGGSKFPIAEELGYDEFSVTFRSINSDEYIEITRKKNSGYYIISTIPGIDSGECLQKDFPYIPLKLMGITGNHKIYSTTKRKKQNVTFSSFSHFFMIDENRIFSELPVLASPFFPKNIIPSLSLLGFLLFNIDANSDKETDDIKTKQIKRTAIKGYIKQKISSLSIKKDELERQLKEYDIAADASEILQAYDEELKETENLINKVTEQNKENLTVISDLVARIQEAQVVLSRYKTLKSQYESDLKRLEFILNGEETRDLFSDPSRCPFCDNELHNDIPETDYAVAAKGEYLKTEKLLADLISVSEEAEEEYSELVKEYKERKKISDDLKKKIENVLKPRVLQLKNALELFKQTTEIKNQLCMLDSIAAEYTAEIKEQDKDEAKDQDYDPRLPLEEKFIDSFETDLKFALKYSNFPGFTTCRLDPTYFDLIVDEKPKEHEGKGYRAYLNSLYATTLFQYLIEHAAYAPFCLVLDSPILSLKEAIDPSEMVESPMRRGLFEYFKKCASYGQVIIIENDIPNISYENANMIYFTKNEQSGRYGFLLDVMK